MGRNVVLPVILCLVILIVVGVIIFLPEDYGVLIDDGNSPVIETSSGNGSSAGSESPDTNGIPSVQSDYSSTSNPSSSAPNLQTNEVNVNSLLTENPNYNNGLDDSTNNNTQQDPILLNQISGMIQNSYGKPVPGASVQISNGELIQSGNDGRFIFRDLDLPDYDLQASASGYKPVYRNAVETGTSNLVIVLVNDGALQGKVIDNTNSPVAYANISVKAVEGIYLQELRSDADGRFELKNPPAEKKLLVTAQQENFTDQGEGIATANPPFNEFIILRLHQPTLSISGRVINQENGQGVSNFHLLAVLDDGSLEKPLEAESSAGGVFRFENLKPGTYIVSSNPAKNEDNSMVVPVGKDYKTVRVLERDARDVIFEVESGIMVTGVVMNQNGQPVGGAEVTVAKIPAGKTVSTFNGQFTLNSVPPLSSNGAAAGITSLRLIATHPQFGSGTSDPLPLGINPINNITISLEGFAALDGMVVNRSNNPVANTRMVLTDLARGESFEQTSRVDGSFSFENLTVADDDSNGLQSTHRIEVFHDQYAPLQQQVIVKSGQVTSIQLRLEGGNQISGQVTDEQRNPIPGVLVRTQLPRGGIATAQSDVTGYYQFPSLPQGKYDLHFRYESNPPLTKVLYGIDAGSTGVLAVLQAGEYDVTGTVTDFDTGEPIQFYYITIRGVPFAQGSTPFVKTQQFNPQNGEYKLTFTEPGEYQLNFSNELYHPESRSAEIGPNVLQMQFVNVPMHPVQQYGNISGIFMPPEGTIFSYVKVVGVGDYPANGNSFELPNLPAGPNNLLFYVILEGGNAPQVAKSLPGVLVNPDQTTVMGTVSADVSTRYQEF